MQVDEGIWALSGEDATMSVSYERWCVAMTMIESLPGYAEAEAVAKARGSNVVDMVSAYLVGIAAGGDTATVMRTPDEVHQHFDRLMDEAAQGV